MKYKEVTGYLIYDPDTGAPMTADQVIDRMEHFENEFVKYQNMKVRLRRLISDLSRLNFVTPVERLQDILESIHE